MTRRDKVLRFIRVVFPLLRFLLCAIIAVYLMWGAHWFIAVVAAWSFWEGFTYYTLHTVSKLEAKDD